MGDPVTMAMIGASAGAMLSPKDPLKGAMLGAAGGYSGGAMLGVGAGASGAAAGTGIGAGGASLPGVMGASNTAAGVASQTALPAGLGGGLPSMIPNMVSTPFSSLAPTAGGMGSAGMAGASGLGGIEQFMQQNPYTTQMGYDYLQNKLQGSPQMPMAQSQGLLRGNQMQPQSQQYQVDVPRISLI